MSGHLMKWFALIHPSVYQGLCAYVLQNLPDAASRGIVVGHDHRHNSERWAQLTAAAFVARGVRVYLHRGLVHTPLYADHGLLAFASNLILRNAEYRSA